MTNFFNKMAKKGIIKIMSSDSREKLSGLTADSLEVGELALITEADYERLYCKNVNDEIVPIHRIFDAGEIEIPKEYLIYTTTGASQNVQLINKQEYAKKITLEDGTDIPITGTGALNYTFPEVGEHKVAIEFKEDIIDLSYCFSACSELTSISENLFTNNASVIDFSFCFSGCTNLTNIPEKLFASNTEVTSFYACFKDCSKLANIPKSLFINNPAVTNFRSCFYRCLNLTAIPKNFFTANIEVTTFEMCFDGCLNLTTIPFNLFATNTAVINFNLCFYNCTGLTGNVPVDNDGTPIYNRSGSGKEGYAIVVYYLDCFTKCISLSDYNSIPPGWNQK